MANRSCTICGGPHYAKGWCKPHYSRWWRYGDPTHVPHRPSAEERFWSQVNKTESCWLWTGKSRSGYGLFEWGPAGAVKCMGAHRYAYSLIKGEIPTRLVLDHLCRIPLCVNPDHLEPVTSRENVLRGIGPSAGNVHKTHCVRGHAYDEANTRHNLDGSRACRACQREAVRKRHASKGKPPIPATTKARFVEAANRHPGLTTRGLSTELGWSEGYTRMVKRAVVSGGA